METEAFENQKNGHRKVSKRWIWCCAGTTATFIFFCCSIPLMAMIGIGMVSANEVTSTETQTLSIDDVDEVINLQVSNPVGATSIVSDRDVDEIEVEIVRRANSFTKSEAEKALDNTEVDVRRDGDTFIVEVTLADHDSFLWFNSPSVDLRITVPDEELNLLVENEVGGLTVRNLDIADRMELINNVGGIEFEGVVGPQGEYLITNDVGGISVQVSQDSSFALEVSAEVGGIDLNLDQQWKETEYVKETTGARYTGNYGEDDAGATFVINTSVGGIEIHD